MPTSFELESLFNHETDVEYSQLTAQATPDDIVFTTENLTKMF